MCLKALEYLNQVFVLCSNVVHFVHTVVCVISARVQIKQKKQYELRQSNGWGEKMKITIYVKVHDVDW